MGRPPVVGPWYWTKSMSPPVSVTSGGSKCGQVAGSCRCGKSPPDCGFAPRRSTSSAPKESSSTQGSRTRFVSRKRFFEPIACDSGWSRPQTCERPTSPPSPPRATCRRCARRIRRPPESRWIHRSTTLRRGRPVPKFVSISCASCPSHRLHPALRAPKGWARQLLEVVDQEIDESPRRSLRPAPGGKYGVDLLRRHAPIFEDPDERAARQLRATSPKPGRNNAQSGHRSGGRAFVDGESEPALDAQRDGTALALERPSC